MELRAEVEVEGEVEGEGGKRQGGKEASILYY